MCCLYAVTLLFVHYFKIWKHVSEKFSSVISSSQGEIVLNQKTRRKHFNFQYLWTKFVVAELAPKSVNFLSSCAASLIPYALRCPYVYWYHFLLHGQHWNHFHTYYIKQNLHLSQISEWIWIYSTKNHKVSQNIYIYIYIFTVMILLGNNQKIELKWKQNLMFPRRYGYGAENLKIIRHLQV